MYIYIYGELQAESHTRMGTSLRCPWLPWVSMLELMSNAPFEHRTWAVVSFERGTPLTWRPSIRTLEMQFETLTARRWWAVQGISVNILRMHSWPLRAAFRSIFHQSPAYPANGPSLLHCLHLLFESVYRFVSNVFFGGNGESLDIDCHVNHVSTWLDLKDWSIFCRCPSCWLDPPLPSAEHAWNTWKLSWIWVEVLSSPYFVVWKASLICISSSDIHGFLVIFLLFLGKMSGFVAYIPMFIAGEPPPEMRKHVALATLLGREGGLYTAQFADDQHVLSPGSGW